MRRSMSPLASSFAPSFAPLFTSSLAAGLFAAALAACGTTPKTHPGGPCEPNHTCDEGQICDLTDPAGAVCLEATGDLDGDGIVNGKDFCEHLAGGDRDEDGDGIGDECDACPIAKPPDTPDADGDAVDSPCDPDPSAPGDKIILFNGFNGPLPGTWRGTPSWQVRGGEVIMTPITIGTVEQLSVPVAVPSNRMAILAAYRVDGITPGAIEARAGVAGINDLPMGGTVLQCGGSRVGASDSLVLQIDSASNTKPQTDLFNKASLYRVGEQIDGTRANCALISDKETGAIPAQTSGAAINRVGLYARDATIRFSYLLVLGH